MAYLALYRKLRPKVFSDIVGQEHIVRILKNQLESGNISHAYLFCGTRGTGKTSTSKIFAKTLNCKNPTANGPCNVCENCLAVEENRSLNVIEIDAASNNGVDNIREIREEVKYPPADGGVKVYIIDEVHMLSTGAFNALLKTLEEPPNHVIFILATTDPQRIPATILSRCQRLDFRRITIHDMAETLKENAEGESINITDEALQYISAISDGAMRDAQSLLDQCMAYYSGEEIDAQKVMAITGAVDKSIFFDLTDALINFNNAKCLEIIEETVNIGRDISRFIADFIYHLRNLLIIGSSSNANIVDISQTMYERYNEQAKNIEPRRLIEYINEFSLLSGNLRYSFNERIMLETLCIKLCNPETGGNDISNLLNRLERLEKQPRTVIKEASPQSDEKKTKNTVIRPKSTPDDINNVIAEWDKFKILLGEPVASFLKDTFAGFLEGDVLCIVFGDRSVINHAKLRENEIKLKLAEEYEKEFPLSFIFVDDYNGKHEDSYGEIDPNSNALIMSLSEKLGGIDIEIDK
ncbi:DNA polymerase III subunit gamma/tau [Tyzzerella sp. OttesenSCG-928-J15]|nr:DNA polymerase III subunit gamma/tau [Tyzzerella sp. OttesenSCG-928-J15]